MGFGLLPNRWAKRFLVLFFKKELLSSLSSRHPREAATRPTARGLHQAVGGAVCSAALGGEGSVDGGEAQDGADLAGVLRREAAFADAFAGLLDAVSFVGRRPDR
jgi:hypothetical protein